MSTASNPAEDFVTDLASRGFLSLWCYPNPRRKDGKKELCDCLIVCDPDVIIMSVKDCQFREDADSSIAQDRWHRKAIDASVQQIYGAERHLSAMDEVLTVDGEKALVLPDPARTRIHRVAVAFGGKNRAWVKSGDFGKGFVHVLDELSFAVVMQELDTVTDVTEYLIAKEAFLKSDRSLFMAGEENLLALYLHSGRDFPTKCDFLWIEDGPWDELRKKPEYISKREADRASYVWDRLIEHIAEDFRSGRMVDEVTLGEAENVLRCMARERRFHRRLLGGRLSEFLEQSRQGKVRSRSVPSPSGVNYVFLACPHGEDRIKRRAELLARCMVIRSMNADRETVVGIATERPGTGRGHSIDVLYMHIPEMTPELRRKAKVAQEEWGYFRQPILQRFTDDEYPAPHDQREQASLRSKAVGRNEPCPCGSGLKFKKCCGKA